MTTTPSIGDTLTNTEWLQAIVRTTFAAGSLSEYRCCTEAYNKILDLVNNEGHPLDDIRDFIDTYGTKAFVDGHYETWADLTENSYSMGAIEAFVEEFGVENIGSFEDAYCGTWGSGAEYARGLVEGDWDIDNIPGFVEIDWEATWRNLSQDYTEIDGHIFHLW